MTKKKLRRMIIIGVLMFFIAASIINYFVSFNEEAKKINAAYNNFFGYDYREKAEAIDTQDYYKQIAENSNFSLGELYMYEHSRYTLGFAQYPYVVALIDAEGNITFASDNYIYIEDYGFTYMTNTYIDIDKYLTDDLKKDIRSFLKEAEYGVFWVSEVKLYNNGEQSIPVEVTVSGNGNGEETFVLTDYEANLVLTNEDVNFTAYFNELEAKSYNRKYFEELKETVIRHYERNKDNFDPHYGGGGYSKSGMACGSLGVPLEKGYEVYFAIEHNHIIEAFLSDYFFILTFYLVIFFAIAAIVFYIMCMKVINKSQKLEVAKSTFISAASHELKTPLAVIQNQCECLMENIYPEKNGQYIKSIYDEALRMNGIVTSLLSYDRISQMTDIKKERCNLSELLKEEVKTYSSFAENAGVIIEENIGNGIYVECNVQLMKMAIDNYLSNAIKYAVGNKVVKVNFPAHNNTLTLEVINEAEESSASVAKEAWSEFSRGDKSRQRQGSSIGMGLPVCKKIFELHGFKGYCQYKDGMIKFAVTVH